MKKLCRLASSTKVNTSPNKTQEERKFSTCVDLRRLASPFGQGFTKVLGQNLLHTRNNSWVSLVYKAIPGCFE